MEQEGKRGDEDVGLNARVGAVIAYVIHASSLAVSREITETRSKSCNLVIKSDNNHER